MVDFSSVVSADATGPHSNRSVSRAIQILHMIARHSRGTTSSELATLVSLPRATVFRLLATLEENGFVDRIKNNYVLGWDLSRLGAIADSSVGVVERARERVQQIADVIKETVTLSMCRPNNQLDVVLQASGSKVGFNVSDLVGVHWPLHASTTGKLALAELPFSEVRERLEGDLTALTPQTITTFDALEKELILVKQSGYSVIEDELEVGIASIAVPIRDDAGSLIAALAAVGPTSRFTQAQRASALPHLVAGARDIGDQLGAFGRTRTDGSKRDAKAG